MCGNAQTDTDGGGDGIRLHVVIASDLQGEATCSYYRGGWVSR